MSNTKKALKYFAKYLKNYWKGVTIVIVLSLISTLSQVLGPLFLGNAVQGLTKAVNKVSSQSHDLSSFYQSLGSMISVYAAGIIASFMHGWLCQNLQLMQQMICEKIFLPNFKEC